MTSDQNERVEQLFGELMDLPAIRQRAALSLETDEQVRAEVESLLGHAGSEGGTLRDAIEDVLRVAASAGALDHRAVGPGTRFDHYRIVSKLGQGGLGDVYEALRDDDFHKRVALKIVRHGMDSDFARRRFEHERQLLAGLEHPYIARLLDGGEADGGCPYIILEYVEGVSISQYCEGLAQDEILQLFLKVCEAVAYAHASLIIHRDLKPGNILVTPAGVPKLLDFGLAKLVEPDGGADVTQTVGVMAMTPQYASPEQVRGGTITTATDVYSLGVVLYEVVTGRRPYEVTSTSIVDLDRVICIDPPAPPKIGGDLDQILLMALRKEPERRYRSVEQMREDIERHLTHRPVHARADTIFYTTRKYVRRNWIWLSAAAIALAGILGGSAEALYRTRIQQRQFERGRQFANRLMVDVDASLAQMPGTVEVRAKVVAASLDYLNDLSKDAGNDPGFAWDLAMAYSKVAAAQWTNGPSLGRPQEALASYEKAIALARPQADKGRLNPKQVESFVGMLMAAGSAGSQARDRDTAARLGREAVNRSRQLPDAVRLEALTRYSSTMTVSGDLAAAEAALAEVVSATRKGLHNPPSDDDRLLLVRRLTDFAVAQHRVTKLAEAKASLTEALATIHPLAETGGAQFDRQLHGTLVRFGDVEGAPDRPSLENTAAAVSRYEESLVALRRLISADAHDLSSQTLAGLAHMKIGFVLQERQSKRALDEARAAIAILDISAPNIAEIRALPRIAAANAVRAMGQYGDAERWLQEAQRLLTTPGANAEADLDLAWAQLEGARGDRMRAAEWFRKTVAAQEILYKKVPTPSYAWNLVEALDAGAAAIPESAVGWRHRAVEVWDEQNRKFPNHTYIEDRLTRARTAVSQSADGLRPLE
jgi:tRNA A-37 threonylcarbamoyl transferase component Bud32/tetratricopeptide (TPR) repeat protein